MRHLGLQNCPSRVGTAIGKRIVSRPNADASPLGPPLALGIRHPLRFVFHRINGAVSNADYGREVRGEVMPRSEERIERKVQVSDVLDFCINLPWQQIASWAVVALLATQLKDFMGVSTAKSEQLYCLKFIKAGLECEMMCSDNQPFLADCHGDLYCFIHWQ
jgi:hypothetical protein